jgi:hypothetical protein
MITPYHVIGDDIATLRSSHVVQTTEYGKKTLVASARRVHERRGIE